MLTIGHSEVPIPFTVVNKNCKVNRIIRDKNEHSFLSFCVSVNNLQCFEYTRHLSLE